MKNTLWKGRILNVLQLDPDLCRYPLFFYNFHNFDDSGSNFCCLADWQIIFE
jgi:hypothetical protein